MEVLIGFNEDSEERVECFPFVDDPRKNLRKIFFVLIHFDECIVFLDRQDSLGHQSIEQWFVGIQSFNQLAHIFFNPLFIWNVSNLIEYVDTPNIKMYDATIESQSLVRVLLCTKIHYTYRWLDNKLTHITNRGNFDLLFMHY